MFIDNLFQQGGAEHSGDCTQRSYTLVLEAESDQLSVPAEFRFELLTKLSFESCTVVAIWYLFTYFTLFSSWHRAKPSTLNRTSQSVRTECQTDSFRYLKLCCIYFWKLVSHPYEGHEHLPHEN